MHGDSRKTCVSIFATARSKASLSALALCVDRAKMGHRSAALLSLSALSAAAAAEYSPAFLWSPKAFGGLAAATEHLREAAAADLESTLVGKSGSLLTDARAAAEAQPEVRLVFLAEGLRTEVLRAHGAALPALDRLLPSANLPLDLAERRIDLCLHSITARIVHLPMTT